ncbi:Ohr family peroxiredoxin [Enterococcus raffinosus]|uniref:Ohr family peroxiredoxin n=1 Tax=Enterococcus raffinosus TaxID=71452 RepID=A0AAW8TD80_9ENTE|nr:Ohr family peroxiredoxin [Enterococcus raffinosus]MDT2523248.1 Ohr family peroxiredoxin [Enterococcus raffinosus]MDT2531266.1 Ohr family peroxiredoxin [Enterococcus raffinosus]MDT2533932.1 Ohr family peroxiredoxin [Enterococcus raffinosus]MDT2544725.1 Ohr family peroxiredoxin [Enterococcus raffinosus]MDT2555997.1 Ohr family peroxiredoxin [Enterococcus raffinosus]
MEKKIYSTTVVNKGGREGATVLPDGSALYDIALPGTKLENGLTDPERLFAAAYSSCFNQALTVAKERFSIAAHSIVSATVDLYEEEDATFSLGVKLSIQMPNVSKKQAELVVKYADRICPYSRALRNNVLVEFEIEN